MNSRIIAYWLAQGVGWSIYLTFLLVGVFAFGPAEGYEVKLFLLQLVIAGSAFLGSHLLRFYFKRNKWSYFTLPRLLPRVLLANLLMAIGAIILIYILMYTVLNWGEIRPIAWKEIPFYTGNIFMIYCVWSILYFSFHYFEQSKQALIEKAQAEAALKEAELIALKAQINPHFLFNSLNNIRGMILEDPTKARDMVSNLADLLRYSISFSQQEKVPLKNEIAIVKDYLDLEMVQYEDRLTYQLEIKPETLEMQIPPMVIQLLVENAVKHGISQLPEGGRIEISTKLNGDRLEIQVENTGQLKTHSSGGIGIQNALERIRILYAMDPQFDLQSSGDLVRATLQIPVLI